MGLSEARSERQVTHKVPLRHLGAQKARKPKWIPGVVSNRHKKQTKKKWGGDSLRLKKNTHCNSSRQKIENP